jgi:hypothetical protein
VFLPQLAGPVLQHPFAFLRNQPGLTGPLVYAIDRGDANFAVLADHPSRRAYVLSVPRGYFDLEPGHNVEVGIDRLRTITGASVDVTVRVNRALARRPAQVRVDVGQRQLVVPVDSGGRGRFTVAAGAHEVRLSSANGGPLVSPADAGTTLSLSVWSGDPGDSAEARTVPLRVRDGRITLLWPGQSVIDTLSHGANFTATATPRP